MAARVGGKVGPNIAEVEVVMDGEPVFGYLTSATRLENGGTFSAWGVRALRAEIEVVDELECWGEPRDRGAHSLRTVGRFHVPSELYDVEPDAEGFERLSRTTSTIGRSSSVRPVRWPPGRG